MTSPERSARQEAEERTAHEYADLIADGLPHDWRTINQAIIDRWSRTALQRIKERAWKLVEIGHDIT